MQLRAGLTLVFPLSLTLAGCPSSDLPAASGSETGDSDTGTGSDTGTESDTGTDTETGDGDGDTTFVLVTRKSLADDHRELLAFDISDPLVLDPPQMILGVPMGEILDLGDPTPWGSHVVHYGAIDPFTRVSEQLVYDGTSWVLQPLLPAGVGPVLLSADFADDQSWALTRTGDPAPTTFARVDFDPSGSPIGFEQVHPVPPPTSLSSLINQAGQAAFMVDENDDGVYQLRLAQIHPSVEPSVVIDDIEVGVPAVFSADLDETKLVYSNDLGKDGANEFFAVDLANLAAPPVLVTTQIAGSQTIRRRVSSTGERLIYWTGDSLWGQLYLVEFVGAAPQAPILLSGADQVAVKGFEFFGDDRVVYLRGDGSDEQAFMLVELEGPSAAVQVSTPFPAGDEIFNYQYDQTQGLIAYNLANPNEARLSLIDLGGASATERLIYTAPASGFIVPSIPQVGRRLAFTAPNVDSKSEVFSVDLDDPNLVATRLDEALPAGWKGPLGVALTSDEAQVVFRSGPEAGPDTAPLRVTIDASSPVEPLYELGWDSLFRLATP